MQPGGEYWGLFFDEVNTSLDLLNQQITELETSPGSREIVDEIFRIVHTIKGMAATVGFQSISKLCHKMEEVFDFYRKNPRDIEKSAIEVEIKALDSLYKIVEHILNNEEESSICTDLSESLCSELVNKLSSLKGSTKEAQQTTKQTKKKIKKEGKKTSVESTKNNLEQESETKTTEIGAEVERQVSEVVYEEHTQNDLNKLKIKINFDPQSQMPAVRAYMATQILEAEGEILQTFPDKDSFVDSTELIEKGLVTTISSDKPLEKFKESLEKSLCNISDVTEVIIELVIDEEIQIQDNQQIHDQNEPQTNTEVEEHLNLSPDGILQKISDKEVQELFDNVLKAYHINLYLAEDVQAPEEQFINLVNNLNDYVGHVIDSLPSIDELKVLKDNPPKPELISSLLEAESIQQAHVRNKARRQLEFILLINGSHKQVLDFLSDSCELRKVEVKELKDLLHTSSETKTEEDKHGEEVSKKESKKEISENVSTGHKTKHSDVQSTFVRVNLATLESLMSSVGELVINHNRIKLSMDENTSAEIISTTQYLHQVTTKIQQLVMSIRMVPVNQVFSRFPRFIRDISRELNKEVQLELEGEYTEIDRIMVDELNEIFIHLVRNAIDHGLETTEEREKVGKPAVGTIKMQAYSQGNNVFVTISDDGKGIDPAKIKNKAIQQKLLTSEQLNLLSKEEVLNLIFASGFSTAEQISDLSGRGVGMDIVKAKVSSLGGQISLSSNQGYGTSFRLSIPSTISIIQGLLINCIGGLYAIPLSEIKEIVSINPEQALYELGTCEIVVFHGETIPIISLAKYLQVSDEPIEEKSSTENQLVVVVESEGKRYGIVVESLAGQQEIVIKPISNRANSEGLVNGATVFGDGRIAMILNIERIIKLYLNDLPVQEAEEILDNQYLDNEYLNNEYSQHTI